MDPVHLSVFKPLKEFIIELKNLGLTLSLLMTTQKAFVDSVDQDQTAQNVQSDLCSTLSTFSFYIISKSFLDLAMEVHMYFQSMKNYDLFIYSVVK